MVLERDPFDGRGRNIGLLDSLSLQRKHGLDFEVEAKLFPIAWDGIQRRVNDINLRQ